LKQRVEREPEVVVGTRGDFFAIGFGQAVQKTPEYFGIHMADIALHDCFELAKPVDQIFLIVTADAFGAFGLNKFVSHYGDGFLWQLLRMAFGIFPHRLNHHIAAEQFHRFGEMTGDHIQRQGDVFGFEVFLRPDKLQQLGGFQRAFHNWFALAQIAQNLIGAFEDGGIFVALFAPPVSVLVVGERKGVVAFGRRFVDDDTHAVPLQFFWKLRQFHAATVWKDRF